LIFDNIILKETINNIKWIFYVREYIPHLKRIDQLIQTTACHVKYAAPTPCILEPTRYPPIQLDLGQSIFLALKWFINHIFNFEFFLTS